MIIIFHWKTQLTNPPPPTNAAYMRQWKVWAFVQIICQAIIYTNAGLLSIGPLGTNFSEILIKAHNFSFIKMHLKLSSAKWRPFCPGETS